MNYFEGLPERTSPSQQVPSQAMVRVRSHTFTVGSLSPGVELGTVPGAVDAPSEARPLPSFYLFCKDFGSKRLVLPPTSAARL